MASPIQRFSNNAISLLANAISNSDTTLSVLTGHGSQFPALANDGSDYFLVTLENQSASVREIIRVGARYGDVLANISRAQEGTTAVAWSASAGNDTLVDHRVTAETMRQAMLLPEMPVIPPAGITGVVTKQNGAVVGVSATEYDFTGAGVTVTDHGQSKTIDIAASNINITNIIQGANTLTPVPVLVAETAAASTVTYSNYQRGFKYFVTIFSPTSYKSCTFEVLGNVSGNIDGNTETVSFNRTSRVGYNFLGNVDITLNITTKELALVWTNLEATPVEVMCTRIQHIA